MTWTARATVQDVSDGPAPIDVLAIANADETYDVSLSNGETVTQSRVISNTEGKIRSVEVRIVLDEDETGIAVGDEIYVSGHFDGKPKPAPSA